MKKQNTDFENFKVKIKNADLYKQGISKKKTFSISVDEDEHQLLQINIKAFNEALGMNITPSNVMSSALRDINRKLASDTKKALSLANRKMSDQEVLNNLKSQIEALQKEYDNKLKSKDDIEEDKGELDHQDTVDIEMEKQSDTSDFEEHIDSVNDYNSIEEQNGNELDQDLKDLAESKPSNF